MIYYLDEVTDKLKQKIWLYQKNGEDVEKLFIVGHPGMIKIFQAYVAGDLSFNKYATYYGLKFVSVSTFPKNHIDVGVQV